MDNKEATTKLLREHYEQIVRLRNDSSLISGFTINTLAGDIHIRDRRRALLLIDYYIKDLQDLITFEMT